MASTTFTNASGSTTVSITGVLATSNIPTGYTGANLTEVAIGTAVTSIANYCFQLCTNLQFVTFGNNSTLTTIGSDAFTNCAIITFEIPASVTTIGRNPWIYCSELTTLTVAAGGSGPFTSDGKGLLNNTSNTLIAYAIGNTSVSYTIPNNIIIIGSYAVIQGVNLTTLVIPEGVTTVDQGAFSQSGLTSLHIPSSMVTLNPDGFSQCNISSLTFAANSNLTTIGTNAFYGNSLSSTPSVVIPASVTTLGNQVFKLCSSLTSVTIPTDSQLTTIGGTNIFTWSGLTTFTAPQSVITLFGVSEGENQTVGGKSGVTVIANSNTSPVITIIGSSIVYVVKDTTYNDDGFTATDADQDDSTLTVSTTSNVDTSAPGTYTVTYSATDSVGVTVTATRTVYVVVTLPTPTCFPAGTPVQTDQGELAIEQLVPGKHTVRGKSIIAITQTRPLQKHVVCFKKDSLCRNVPSQQTLCSKEHKVLYRGEMTKARDLADMCKNVKKVSYNGETLFNVLLEKHGKMLVNNMICETLHPENISAKFAKSKNTSKKNVMLK